MRHDERDAIGRIAEEKDKEETAAGRQFNSAKDWSDG
jgi:hypothetical protein